MCMYACVCIHSLTYKPRGGWVGLNGLLGVALDHVPEMPQIFGVEDVEGLGGVELPVLHVRTEQVIVWTGIPLFESTRERGERKREGRGEGGEEEGGKRRGWRGRERERVERKREVDRKRVGLPLLSVSLPTSSSAISHTYRKEGCLWVHTCLYLNRTLS